MKLPRFKLRTLFVLIALISIPLGWAAYQLNWQRRREKFLTRTHAGKLHMGLIAAPWSLRLFGEIPADYLLNVADVDVEEARSLFPEAIKINPAQSDFPQRDVTPVAP
jgi:hypothetical protein